MKKLFTLVFLAAISTANAQIIIYDTDFPTAGTSFWMADDNELGGNIDLGTAGTAPQTWDFSMLETDSIYQLSFYDPTTVDPDGVFPSADIAMDQAGGYAFGQFGPNDVQIIGIAADFGVALGLPASFDTSVSFTDPWKIFEFPSSNGTAYSDTAVLDFTFGAAGLIPPFIATFWDPDSIRVLRTIYSETEIDAEGTLTDVTSASHDVLRQFVNETTIDSIWGRVSGTWAPAPSFPGVFENPQTALDSSYRFIGKDVGYIVVDVNVDGDGNPTSATFMSDPSFCCTGVEEMAASGIEPIYPNPANDAVQVRTGGDLYTFQVVDMSGKLLMNTRLTYDRQTVSLSGLASGLYVYRLIAEDGHLAHAGRLSRTGQ